MKDKEKITSSPPSAGWTSPEPYIGAMARKRSYRRAREDKPRSQLVTPHPWLSTVPFAAILAVLAILAAAIIFAAFPGRQPAQKPPEAPVREQGTAAAGWFQEAQKQFHK